MEQNAVLELKVEDGRIICNVENYALAVESLLKKYDYVVSEENYEQAKKDKALLNSQLEEIKKHRIDFEKTYFAEWNTQKTKLMNVEKKIQSVSDGLNKQVKELDERVKAEKKQQIAEYFYSLNLIPIELSQIFDEKWLLKSCKEADYKKAIDEFAEKYTKDIAFIKSLGMEDEVVYLNYYSKYLDLTSAKELYDAYIKNKREVEKAYEREQEEIKAKEAAKEAAKEVKQEEVVNTNETQESVSNEPKEADTPKLITTYVELVGTKEDLNKLLNFINTQTKIKCQPIKKEEKKVEEK